MSKYQVRIVKKANKPRFEPKFRVSVRFGKHFYDYGYTFTLIGARFLAEKIRNEHRYAQVNQDRVVEEYEL